MASDKIHIDLSVNPESIEKVRKQIEDLDRWRNVDAKVDLLVRRINTLQEQLFELAELLRADNWPGNYSMSASEWIARRKKEGETRP